ncbi:MAG TPA: magnesium transporter CorA family protein [Candidatus Eisenbacteria bacterium]|nr:magnesium transporter CorA family protein [Candidatus Eisenbacteria bacterium]
MKQEFTVKEGRVVQAAPGEGTVRVYGAPTDEERREILATTGIDGYTLASVLDPEEIPRVEVEDDYLLLIWKRPTPAMFREGQAFRVSSMGALLHQGRLTFITADEAPDLGRVRTRSIDSLNELLLRELLSTVRHFSEHLRVIQEIARDIQRKLNASIGNEHLLRMFALTEGLIYYLTAVEGNGGALGRLKASSDRLKCSEEDQRILEDLIIENAQCARQAAIYSDVLSSLMDARGAIINNNMNVLLRNLTLINVVFLPLGVLASVGGMSEFTMMTGSARDMHGPPWWVTYPAFLLVLALIGFVTWWLLRRWMERTMGRSFPPNP